jgi:DNA-binding NtrC family response regulator
MKPRLILLFTSDPEFEDVLNQALQGDDPTVLVRHTLERALETVCSRGKELDSAVIDFADGCHGMTLLRAIKGCRQDLPIIVVTSSDFYHAATMAYANDVSACLAKPVTGAELKLVLEELQTLKPLLTA